MQRTPRWRTWSTPWVVGALLIAACGSSTDDPSAGGAELRPAATETPVPEIVTPTAVDEAPIGVAPSSSPLSPPAVEPADSATEDLGLQLPLEPPPFAAMVTGTGVPVAVLAAAPDGQVVVRTPCGNIVNLDPGTELPPIEVVIDPGHGGPIDTGAVGANGLVERDLNLTLSLAAEAVLIERGISVELTRTGDYLLPLSVRAAFADHVGATIMVSVHHNAPRGNASDVPGTEVFVQTGSEDSERLGGLLFAQIQDALAVFPVGWTSAPDAGVLRVLLPSGTDAYGMIRRPETPTALVELGYLANPEEAELFTTQAYIDVASVALADAIEAYLRTDEVGRGYGNPPRVFTPNFAPGADVCTDPWL